MTIHARKGRSMGWNYAGIALLVALILVALALVAGGRFGIELDATRSVLALGALLLVFGALALAMRRR
jgi:hypothetical protein